MFIISQRSAIVKRAGFDIHIWAGFSPQLKPRGARAGPAAYKTGCAFIRLAVPPPNCFEMPRKAEGGAGTPSHGHVRKTVFGSAARVTTREHRSPRAWLHGGVSR